MTKKIVWDEVQSFNRQPHKSLVDIVKKHEYVFEKRTMYLFRCRLKNQKIIFEKQSGEAERFIKKRMCKISEHLHRGYKHTVHVVKPDDVNLLKKLRETHNLNSFNLRGWHGIFERYICVRKSFFDLTDTDLSEGRVPFYSLNELQRKLLQYSAKHECDVKDARFALMLEDEQFRSDYKHLMKNFEEDRRDYEFYKRHTDELDKLEEEHGQTKKS